MLFLALLCPLIYLQDRVPYQRSGSFPAVPCAEWHSTVCLLCACSDPVDGHLGGFQSFAPTNSFGVDLAFDHTRDCNCRGESWEWNCWVT